MIGQYVTVHGDVISHVNITHVMVEDGGEYSCIAENRAGKVSHAARLNIYGMCICMFGACDLFLPWSSVLCDLTNYGGARPSPSAIAQQVYYSEH